MFIGLPDSPETVPLRFGVSPETSFFGGPPPTASVERSSRYREDWEELEFLVCHTKFPLLLRRSPNFSREKEVLGLW